MSADAAFPYEIRAAGQTDLPFIFSTWLKSFRKSPWARQIPPTIYFRHEHDRVAQNLNDSQTLIAHPANDPDTILGWACGRGQLIHWVYVKRTWRGLGIGRKLAGELVDLASPFEFTRHPGPNIPSWLKTGTLNPYL